MARTPARLTKCPRCGAQLARDNTSGRCAPCQAAERDRLVSPPALPASFWDHEPIQQSAAERHLGKVIRAYRCHPYHGRHPLPQETVARWLGITQAQLSRVENGRPIIHLDRLTHWAQILRIPEHLLWFKLPSSGRHDGIDGHLNTTPATASLDADEHEEWDTVDRRRLLASSAAAPFLAILGTAKPRITADDARQIRSMVPEIYALDDQVGGDAIGKIASWCLGRVDQLLNSADYPSAVGQQLQAAYGELAEMVGWLYFDAGRFQQARFFYSEALRAAQLADDLNLEVLVLASMNTLARYRGRPREAVQLIQLAQRRAAGWATPRLSSLLHAREAVCLAQLHDANGSRTAMQRSLNTFRPGVRDDDPPWIAYFDTAELYARQATASTYLGRPEQAAAQMRTAVTTLAPRFQRNRAYYGIRAGLSYLAAGDETQAYATVRPVLPAFVSVKSGRAHARLGDFLSQIGHSRKPEARDLLDYAHELGIRRRQV